MGDSLPPSGGPTDDDVTGWPPPAPDTRPSAAPGRAPGKAAETTPGTTDVEPPPAPTVERMTTSAEGVTAELWAFRFADPVMAQEALLAAMRLQAHKRLQLDDAAIVTRDPRGRIRITQTREMSTAQGAMSGSWVGLLAGLFVPGGPLVGMAIGAAAGGLFAKLRDKGIKDDEMKQWGEHIGDGEAALFLLVEDCHRMRVLYEASRFPATLLTSTGDPEFAAKLGERFTVDPWGP